MKLCRFSLGGNAPRVGLIEGDRVLDLASAGLASLTALAEAEDAAGQLRALKRQELPAIALDTVRLLAPVERQEIWAAGVTYLRSRAARMEESEFSASAYDRVYDAARPELFFKSMPEKAVGPGDPVGIRADARWSVPEPELVLVINSRGRIVGCTIGNDMSSRDIEGENLLYLPQAKIYDRSCAVGPCVVFGIAETEARQWTVQLQIVRSGQPVFTGETVVDKIKRRFEELADYLFRSQQFPHGALLLTGTGIIPPDQFTLQAGDDVRIQISGIGELRNPVMTV